MFCTECGKPMPDDVKFCRNCGHNLALDALPSTVAPELVAVSKTGSLRTTVSKSRADAYPHPPARRASRSVGLEESRTRRYIGIRLALIVAIVLLALNPIFTKNALRFSDPLFLLGIASLMGACALFLAAALSRNSLRPRPLGLIVVLGLLQTTVIAGVHAWGWNRGATDTALIDYLMPFLVMVIASISLGERYHIVTWLSSLVGLVGFVMVVHTWYLWPSHRGYLAILPWIAALAWTGSVLVFKHMLRKEHAPLVTLVAWQMLIGCVPLLATQFIDVGSPRVAWSGGFVAYFLALGFGCGALGMMLWFTALSRFSAATVGLGTLAAMVITPVAAYYWLGEQNMAIGTAAFALLCVAVLLLFIPRALIDRLVVAIQRDTVSDQQP